MLMVSPIECSSNTFEEGEIELLSLPIEILKHILSYVNEPSRKNVVLVCQTFYELICELERDKNPLDICYSEVRYSNAMVKIRSFRRTNYCTE